MTDLSGQFRSRSGFANDVNSSKVIAGSSNLGAGAQGELPPRYPCIYDLDSATPTDLRPVVGNEGQ